MKHIQIHVPCLHCNTSQVNLYNNICNTGAILCFVSSNHFWTILIMSVPWFYFSIIWMIEHVLVFFCVISHIFSLLSGLFLEGHKRPWKANRRTILFRAWNDHLLESISFIIGPKFRWNGNLKIRVKSSNPPHLGRRSKIQNEQIELNDKIFRIFIITKNLPSLSPIWSPHFADHYGAHTWKSGNFR